MTDHPWFPDEVRRRAAEAIRQRREALAADIDVLAAAAFPGPSGDVRARLVGQIIDLLAATLAAPGDGSAEAADPHTVEDAGLRLVDLFAAVRLAERSALEELALDDAIGAASQHWPVVTELLRSASFDLLARYCERQAPGPGRNRSRPTGLVLPEVFDIALAKELQRGNRYHHPVSLILFEVDNLAGIQETHGRGVRDLVLERLGIFVGSFFREPDWVGLYGIEAIAVLLPETTLPDASALAEGARQAVERRMVFADRDERPVVVTVSAAVVAVTLRGDSIEGREALDVLRVMTEAEAGVKRAQRRGGNTIERVEVARESFSVNEAAVYLHCSPGTVRKLIAAGTLPSLKSGGRLRVDRLALEAYGQRQPRAQRSAHPA